jgi:hypothetical protein
MVVVWRFGEEGGKTGQPALVVAAGRLRGRAALIIRKDGGGFSGYQV